MAKDRANDPRRKFNYQTDTFRNMGMALGYFGPSGKTYQDRYNDSDTSDAEIKDPDLKHG